MGASFESMAGGIYHFKLLGFDLGQYIYQSSMQAVSITLRPVSKVLSQILGRELGGGGGVHVGYRFG